MKYEELQLDSRLMNTINGLGYTECTPIQEQAIPHILAGKDVAGLAQTGTGKTAAFVIPIMDRILKSENQNQITTESVTADSAGQAAGAASDTATPATPNIVGQTLPFTNWRAQNFILILVPTRELAEQVQDNVNKLGEATGLKGFAIYGGTGYDKQKDALRNSVTFIVATPGRLIDLYKEHLVDLKQVRAIIFDEADRMFDMGFKDDMKYILSRVPQDRQFLVFSATLNFEVLNTAYQFGSEPIEINISKDQAKAENVKDEIYHVGDNEKPMHLVSIMNLHKPKQLIIFTNFKHNVERIAKFLTDNGHPAMAISSLLTQVQRNKVIEQFKAENDSNILVATDVAARGLDIKGVDMVINYELPSDCESYVHRIGRTGRANTTGTAYSLVCDKDIDALYRIEEYLKHKIDVAYMEDKDLQKEFKPMRFESSQRRDGPFRKEGGGGRGGGNDRGPRREHGGGGGRGGDRADARPPERKGASAPYNPNGPKPQPAGATAAHKGNGHKDHGTNGAGRPAHKPGPNGAAKPHHAKPAGDRGPHKGTPIVKAPNKRPIGQGAKAAKKAPPTLGSKIKSVFKRLFGQ